MKKAILLFMIVYDILSQNVDLKNLVDNPKRYGTTKGKKTDSPAYTYEGSCKQNDPMFCIPYQGSFISNILQSLSDENKFDMVNEQLSYYSMKKLKVTKSEWGFGLQSLDGIKPNDLLFKYDIKKTISSKGINFGMFFSKNIRKYQPNFTEIREIFYRHQFRQMLSLLMHFSRFQQSFLRNDLSGCTNKCESLLCGTIEYELSLLKYEMKHIYNEIINQRKQIHQQYEMFRNSIFNFYSQEEFRFYFEIDDIYLEDFVMLKYLVGSRTHNTGSRLDLYPGLHYANAKIHVKNETIYQLQRFNHNIVYVSHSNVQKQSEIFIDYGVSKIINYPLKFGYSPKYIQNLCETFVMLSSEESHLYKVPTQGCLSSNLHAIKAFSLVQILQKLHVQIDIPNTKDFITKDNFYYLSVYLDEIQPGIPIMDLTDYWSNVLEMLKSDSHYYNTAILRFQDYQKYRQAKNKNSYVAQVYIDFFTLMNEEAKRTKEDILKIIKWINKE